jgi:hypothetical protein
MVAALCAFVGTGVVVAADNSSSKKDTPNGSASAAQSTATEGPKAAGFEDFDFSTVNLNDDSTEKSEDEEESSKPSAIGRWISSWFQSATTKKELSENDALSVVEVLQEFMSEDDMGEMQKAVKADNLKTRKQLAKAYEKRGLLKIKTIENGKQVPDMTASSEILRLGTKNKCFAFTLQEKCKGKAEKIIEALDLRLTPMQATTLKNALTNQNTEAVKTWDALANAWNYTHTKYRYYLTYPLWKWIAKPILNNKLLLAVVGCWLLSGNSSEATATTPATPVNK